MSSVRLLLLLALALVVLPWQPTARACPEPCYCSDDNMVDCYGRQLEQVPEGLPADTFNLDLEDNTITKLDSSKLSKLASLQSLRMRMNRLTALGPDDLSGLWNLKQLNLASNEIAAIDNGTFEHTPNLEVLTLMNNALTTVSGMFSPLASLERLDLSLNQITRIEDEDFKGLGKLTYLNLAQNKISQIPAAALGPLPDLNNLVLRGNPLSNINTLFAGLKRLNYVDMSSCLLTNIPKDLPSALRSLNLAKNHLTSVRADAFIKSPSMSHLTLDSNNITIIEDGALDPLKGLRILSVANNQLHALPLNLPASLLKFQANNNNIQRVLQDNFAHGSKLMRLSLNGNNISELAANTFSRLGRLTSFFLGSNAISNIRGLTFQGLTNLALITLDSNPIGRIEPRAFKDLGRVNQMKLSDIASGAIDIDGDVFHDMSSLTGLDVSNSPALAAKILSTSQLQRGLTSLRSLNLRQTHLVSLPISFQTALPRLRALQLSGNPWRCDKDLIDLRRWILNDKKSFPDRRRMLCDSPPSLKGRAITSVEEVKFLLPTATVTTTEASPTSTASTPTSSTTTSKTTTAAEKSSIMTTPDMTTMKSSASGPTSRYPKSTVTTVLPSVSSVTRTDLSTPPRPTTQQPTTSTMKTSQPPIPPMTTTAPPETAKTTRTPSTTLVPPNPSSASYMTDTEPSRTTRTADTTTSGPSTQPSTTSTSQPSSTLTTHPQTPVPTVQTTSVPSSKPHTTAQPTTQTTTKPKTSATSEPPTKTSITSATTSFTKRSVATPSRTQTTTTNIVVDNPTTSNQKPKTSPSPPKTKEDPSTTRLPRWSSPPATTPGGRPSEGTQPRSTTMRAPPSSTIAGQGYRTAALTTSDRRNRTTTLQATTSRLPPPQTTHPVKPSARPSRPSHSITPNLPGDTDKGVARQSVGNTAGTSGPSNLTLIIICAAAGALVLVILVILAVGSYKYRQRQKRLLLDNAVSEGSPGFPAETVSESVLIIDNMAGEPEAEEPPSPTITPTTMSTFRPGARPSVAGGPSSPGASGMDEPGLEPKPKGKRRSWLFSRSSSTTSSNSAFDCMGFGKAREEDGDMLMTSWDSQH